MYNKFLFSFSILFLLFTISCKDKPGGPEIIEYKIKNKPGFTLKIKDQGQEPRKLLKFNFKEGFTQNGKMIMEMDVQNTMDGNSSPKVYMPSIIMPVNSTVEKINDDGTATIRFEIKEITVEDRPNSNPQLVSSLKQVYSKIRLISCTGEVDTSGAGTKPECEFTGDMEPSLVSSVKQMMESSNSNYFVPEYPVGIGAIWEITNPAMDSGGMVVSYTSLQELVKLEGDIATIDATLTMSADKQTVKFPGTEFDSQISSVSGGGSSKIDINFNELLPQGSANSNTEVAMTIQMPDSKETKIVTDMDANIKFTY